jgi:Uri superfamily endonuclease
MEPAASDRVGLAAELRAAAGGDARGITDSAALPVVAGAYLLLVRLSSALPLPIPRLSAATLPPGWYVYAGSARGPGGIRARAGRHLRRGKRPHWHVDHLSEAAAELRVFAVPGARECDLLRGLLARPGFDTALAGFGSSDCRSCAGHLLAVRPGAGGRRAGTQFR